MSEAEKKLDRLRQSLFGSDDGPEPTDPEQAHLVLNAVGIDADALARRASRVRKVLDAYHEGDACDWPTVRALALVALSSNDDGGG